MMRRVVLLVALIPIRCVSTEMQRMEQKQEAVMAKILDAGNLQNFSITAGGTVNDPGYELFGIVGWGFFGRGRMIGVNGNVETVGSGVGGGQLDPEMRKIIVELLTGQATHEQRLELLAALADLFNRLRPTTRPTAQTAAPY